MLLLKKTQKKLKKLCFFILEIEEKNWNWKNLLNRFSDCVKHPLDEIHGGKNFQKHQI